MSSPDGWPKLLVTSRSSRGLLGSSTALRLLSETVAGDMAHVPCSILLIPGTSSRSPWPGGSAAVTSRAVPPDPQIKIRGTVFASAASTRA